MAIEVLI